MSKVNAQSPHLTALVPYHGLVDWPRPKIDQYAKTLYGEHQPRRAWRRKRKFCTACADVWPCAAYIWAEAQVNYDRPGERR